jgi:DNA modification methylase
MKIEKIAIDKLLLDPANARKHGQKNLDSIKGSLAKFGQQKPIVVNADNVIVAGNGTMQAAKELGWKEINIVRTDLKGSDITAFGIADNRTSELAEWDDKVLSELLEGLKAEDFDLSAIGFDIDDMNEMIGDKNNAGLTDPDEVPEPPKVPKTKLGDIWQLGNHRLMCGDSTDAATVAMLMDGKKADMVFTDPPYGVSYEGGHNKKKRSGIIADTLEGDNLTGLFYGAISCALSVTKDGAAFYVWYASGKSVETYASLNKLPLKLRAVIQWYKVKSGLGAFMSQYIPNCEPCMYLHKTNCSPAWYGPTNEKTVWELKKESRNDYHPTQKPVELPERAANNSSKQGDTILDLFGGSGSTLIACEKIGRHARLMELDPIYCDVIIKRWEDFTGKKAVLINEN